MISKFNRVAIIENGEIIEHGYLNKMMPQEDCSYLYEIFTDSGKTYVVTANSFVYEEEDGSKR